MTNNLANINSDDRLLLDTEYQFQRRTISKSYIRTLAIEKYYACGNGIQYRDVMESFQVGKNQAQRTLKYFHHKVLFTASDLKSEDLYLLQNKNPQQYFPICKKAEIIEKLKKRNGANNNLEFQPLSTRFNSRELDLLEEKKAHTFLDLLLLLPYFPIHIHKVQLKFHISRGFYAATQEIAGNKKIGTHEEIIGRRHIRYILSLNGTVQIFIRSNDVPFRLESELDESMMFSFIGQVKDRLLYVLEDPKELVVPPVTDWILTQCDVNKDIEIDNNAQLTLRDIQLKQADRVFREYVKIMQGKAYCRIEESTKFDQLLPMALTNIRLPMSLAKRIDCLESRLHQLTNGYDDNAKREDK